MAFIVFACASVLIVAWLIGEPWWVERRRARLRARPFPAEWREILRRRVPYVRGLPADLQLQLKQHILVFLAEKPIIGCGGLVVTDEMRVTIAAQACLLLLNRSGGYYPKLRRILLYPAAFVVDRPHTDGSGVLHEARRALSGESWSQGQVLLSWEDTRDGADVPDDGRNVVIHEFAHQLDQQEGAANGAPGLPSRQRRAAWARVMSAEYARLRDRMARGLPGLIDPYGATDPAEFFAVVSELFFEQPQRLAAEHPSLYNELGRFYRVNPLSW
ncbi:MAG: zinc-dependent peptidase [Proteobacteria bacterium]|nr:zinc-dependent peptidase [Pseudomonadota bacterium]